MPRANPLTSNTIFLQRLLSPVTVFNIQSPPTPVRALSFWEPVPCRLFLSSPLELPRLIFGFDNGRHPSAALTVCHVLTHPNHTLLNVLGFGNRATSSKSGVCHPIAWGPTSHVGVFRNQSIFAASGVFLPRRVPYLICLWGLRSSAPFAHTHHDRFRV